MLFERGDRLGPYEITTAIGAGGMGEVYQARDTRLGRNVAIKVLPARLSNEPALRKRFQREARAISSLNHPNICALYDIGSENDSEYLVMELLDGETLAHRLERGAMPLDEAIARAIEIASALESAHKQEIIHRDLKPGNVMLTHGGAKLLDFGLARLAETAESEASAGPLTVDGGLVGTIEYMAPEQLSGGRIDARTDIFSFGCVLYEMLTGARPFRGENRASVIGSILFGVPQPLSRRRDGIPMVAERLVQACLEKQPDDRIQTARDLRRELEWIAEGATTARPRATERRRRWVRRAMVSAALAVLVATTVGWLAFFGPRWRPLARREIRFTLASPVPGTEIDWPILSPDGSRLAFIVEGTDGKASLWIRDLSSTVARQVPGSEGVQQPFWSADGTSLAFFAHSKLVTFSLGAAAPQPIETASAPRGGAWGRDGTILFAPYITTGIFGTSSLGAKPHEVTHLSHADLDLSHRWPEFLPDGHRFIYVIQSRNLQRNGLYLADVASGRSQKIANVRSRTIVTADGYLMFVSSQRLYRQRFDLDKGEVVGIPEVVADNVNVDLKLTGATAVSAARDGSFTWLSKPDARSELVLLDRSGKRERTIGPPHEYVNAGLSPDGSRIAVSVIDEETGRNSIELIDVKSGQETPFVADDANADQPIWSPLGDQIAYTSDRRGEYDVFARSVASVGADRLLFAPGGYSIPMSWRTSGTLFNRSQSEGGANSIWLWPAGAKAPHEIMKSEYGQADLSPDGHWLLCVLNSNDTVRTEVFIQSIDDANRRRQISNGGGAQPRWSANGREIYYIDPTLHLVAASFENEVVGTPHALFATPIAASVWYANDYAVASDGAHFLVNAPLKRAQTATAIVVIK